MALELASTDLLTKHQKKELKAAASSTKVKLHTEEDQWQVKVHTEEEFNANKVEKNSSRVVRKTETEEKLKLKMEL